MLRRRLRLARQMPRPFARCSVLLRLDAQFLLRSLQSAFRYVVTARCLFDLSRKHWTVCQRLGQKLLRLVASRWRLRRAHCLVGCDVNVIVIPDDEGRNDVFALLFVSADLFGREPIGESLVAIGSI